MQAIGNFFSVLQRNKKKARGNIKERLWKDVKDSNSAVVISKVLSKLITKNTIYFDPGVIVASRARTQNINFVYLV